MSKKKLDGKGFAGGLTKQQLVELDGCVACGECLKWCPIQDVTEDTSSSPPARIAMFREFIGKESGLMAKLLGPEEIDAEKLKTFRDGLWKCVLCGNCGEVCEVGIDTKKLWWALRKGICESKVGMPEALKGVIANYQKNRSPFPKPLTNRYKFWLPDDIKPAAKAEIGFYEGCGGAWDAAVSAEGAVRLLNAGGPFTMLDPEKAWCCGWPMVAGSGDWSVMPELVQTFVTEVKNKGIKRLAVICPMCRDIFMWLYPQFYGGELPFEPVMASEVIAEYIAAGRIKFTKTLKETVANHDPCALARPLVGAPVLEAPRRILKALPGVRMVEMGRTKELTRCCGGSAGQRGLNPDLVVKMSKKLMDEAKSAGADTLVTSCTACYVSLAARTHINPHPIVDEYKHFEEPVKVNDLLQYAAALL